MRCLAFCALGIALLCSTIVPASAGSSPPTAGFQAIASPAGYRFQAPASWLQLTFPSLPRGVDAMVVSTDGNERVIGGVVPVPTSVQPFDLSQAVPALVASFTQSIESNGGSGVTVFQGPDSIDIAGAAAAESFTASFTDNTGDPSVETERLATRGNTLYVFALRSPEDFSSSDPRFAAILDSFQLTAPTLSADLATPPPAFSLSSEEAVLALLPYKLGPQDGLSDYIPSSAVTARGTAADAPLGVFPSERFSADLQAGYVVGFAQTLEPVSSPDAVTSDTGRLNIILFDTAAHARASATGQSSPPGSNAVFSNQPVTLSTALGDASAGWHFIESQPNLPSRAYFQIRWQRGPVAFALTTQPMPLGEEQQSNAENLATAIDTAEERRAPLSLGSPTITPPVTEAQRLQAALQLKPFPLPASAMPAGFEAEQPFYVDAATLVAAAAHPETELSLTDGTWKMVISERQVFRSQQTSGVELLATATTSTDRQGAAAIASSLASDPGSVSAQVAAPVSLGDSTYAYYDTPDQTGNPEEGQEIYWTHGAVVLSARMFGPPGTTSMDQVVALAQQIDASSQAELPAPPKPSAPLVR
jgi:hypothetical protein